jgi:hypothetical protein
MTVFYRVTDPIEVEKMKNHLVKKYGYFQPYLEDVLLDRWKLPDTEYHTWTLDPHTGQPIAYESIDDKFFLGLKPDPRT